MSVEIITHNQGEVLDLTGGADEPIEELEVGGAEGEQTTDTTIAGELPEVVEGDGESDTSNADGDADSTPELADGEFYFGDEQVSVTVPDEIKEALTEAGIDEKVLLGELFAKGGKFELTEDTRTKLEAKFGKIAVNGYLNMYKQMNESSVKERAAAAESIKATEAEYGKEYSELVGGSEGLAAMEAFVLETFDEKQLASYNAIMEMDNHAAHMLVLSQVKQSMELQNKLKNGDTSIKLLGDETASGSATVEPISKGFLTSAEFQKAMDSDKYWSDREYMAKVDAARNAGIRKGV